MSDFVVNLIIPGDYITTDDNDSSAALISTVNNGDGFGFGLLGTVFPLLLMLLVVLSVLGFVYRRR